MEQARYEAEYVPWSQVDDIDVPVEGYPDFNYVRVPWVCAASAEAVTRSAIVVTFLLMQTIHRAQEAKEKADQAPQALKALVEAKYDPPLVHFFCPKCEETWDAWVDEAGHLEDQRNVCCANSNCERLGMPAILVDEEDA